MLLTIHCKSETIMSFNREVLLLRTLTILLFFKPVFCAIVEVQDGFTEGTLLETRSGEKFNAFLKIPFAEAPIDELRFRSPVRKSSWQGILNCTSFGPMCMQENSFNYPMSEDCLHLNVFTKNVPTEQNFQLKPVIVYIHGGGFDSGSSIEHGPEYLMEREVVLVTINYRLGAFGFLALEKWEAPGNQGLKDQTLALKWIQRNINRFGGDPNLVTIAGLSAGGYAVIAHMVSSMSQGLFKNVIAMSGALAWQKKLKSNNIVVAKELANKINCTLESSDLMLECFMNVSLT